MLQELVVNLQGTRQLPALNIAMHIGYTTKEEENHGVLISEVKKNIKGEHHHPWKVRH